MESGSVYDLIPQIVSLYVSYDTYYSGSGSPEYFRTLLSHLNASWLGDLLTENKVLVKQGSGGFSFAKDIDGDYNPPVGTNMMLTDNSGNFRLKDTSGKFYDFDSSGRMDQWSDAHGNKVDWTYTDDKLTQVTTKIGGTTTSRYMRFGYSGGDHITDVNDSAGRAIEYAYDANDQLTSHTNPDGNDVTYDYDPNFAGALTKVYSPDNPTTAVNTTVYDTLGRVKQKTNAVNSTWDYYLAYYRAETLLPPQLDPNDNPSAPDIRYSSSVWLDKFGQPISAKDVLGRETSYSFDGVFRPTQVVNPSGTSTQYEYNEDHQVTNVITSAVSGSEYADLETIFGYATFENNENRFFMDPNYTQDPAENEIVYEYDFDDIPTHTTQVGNLMKITYPDVNLPSSGVVTPTETFTYDANGLLLTKTGKDGVVTRMEYNNGANGATLKKTIADYGTGKLNITTEMTYDSVGRVTSVKDPRGYTTQTQYYDSGLVKKVDPPSSDPNVTYEYYPSGLVKYVKSHTSSGVVYLQSKTYTTIGQVATVRGPYPASPTAAQLAINYTQYQYDALGRLWKVTDAEDNMTETRYYPDSKTRKVIDPNGQAQVTYTYDEYGQVSTVKDANDNETSYTYNGFRGANRTTYEDGTYTETGYDSFRRATRMRTRSGDVITVRRNDLNQVTGKSLPFGATSYNVYDDTVLPNLDGDPNVDPFEALAYVDSLDYDVIRYDFDDVNDVLTAYYYGNAKEIAYVYDDIMGRLTDVNDWHGITSYSCDSVGRVTDVDDFNGRVVSYEYDAAGNRTKLTYPDITDVNYVYDALGRVTEINNSSGVLAEYTYDELSRYQRVDYANDANAVYSYDSGSRLLSLTNNTGNDLHKYEYTYDDVGNRLTMKVDNSAALTHTYTYELIGVRSCIYLWP